MLKVFLFLMAVVPFPAIAHPEYSVSQKALDAIPIEERAVFLPQCSPQRLPYACAADAFSLFSDYHYVLAGNENLYPLNFFIRYKNYASLDALTSASDEEKKKFIELYRKTTGFPDLAVVSDKIEENFYNAVKRTENVLNASEKTDKFTVLFAGFSPASYWGAKASFPTDELENAYIIIKGNKNADLSEEQKTMYSFSDVLFSNLDNRLIPSKRETILFSPHVVTMRAFLDDLTMADAVTRKLLKNGKEDEYKKLKYNTVSDVSDMAKVSAFNNDVRKIEGAFPERLWTLAFILEPLSFHPLIKERGKLTSEQAEIKERLEASPFYDLTNVFVLQGAVKKKVEFEKKNSVKNRRHLEKTFEQKSVAEQYAIVRELVKNAAGDGMHDILWKYYKDDAMPAVFRKKGYFSFRYPPLSEKLVAEIQKKTGEKIPQGQNVLPLPEFPKGTSASDKAIAAYDMFADSRYLLTHDKTPYLANRLVSAKNFKVIGSLQTTVDKRRFIDHYKKVTGFPDLAEVSKRLNDYFFRFTKELSDRLNAEEKTDAYTIMFQGYFPICSVGYGLALPGSDLDGGYILLKGTKDAAKDKKITERYLKEYVNKIDQRLITVSMDVFTVPQIMTTTEFLDELDKYDTVAKKFMTPEKREKYLSLKQSAPPAYHDMFEYQNFVWDLCSYLKKAEDKERFLYFDRAAEALYANITALPEKAFDTKEQREFIKRIQKSDTMMLANYRFILPYVNTGHSGNYKSKLKNRIRLSHEFNDWPVDKQFELVRELVKLPTAEHDPLVLLPYTANNVSIGKYFSIFKALVLNR